MPPEFWEGERQEIDARLSVIRARRKALGWVIVALIAAGSAVIWFAVWMGA